MNDTQRHRDMITFNNFQCSLVRMHIAHTVMYTCKMFVAHVFMFVNYIEANKSAWVFYVFKKKNL